MFPRLHLLPLLYLRSVTRYCPVALAAGLAAMGQDTPSGARELGPLAKKNRLPVIHFSAYYFLLC